MANINSMLSIEQSHVICTDNIDNNCTNVTICGSRSNCNNPKYVEDIQCFVCDIKIQGRHYALATCRTQASRTRVIEKLGELVGERYMVVISEDDVICRSCANLINTLDRLEVEMSGVRDNVLRFLEKKYSLEEGELLISTEKQKRSQPPQITKCNKQSISNCQSKDENVILSANIQKPKHKKSNTWLQCDKCQYTALHNSFMVQHIKDRVRKEKIFCDKCGLQFYESQQELHNCNMKEHMGNHNRVEDKQAGTSLKDIHETILDIPVLEKSLQRDVPIMTIETYSESQMSNRLENIPLIRLSNPENISIENILTPDNPGSGQSIYVRVLQPVEINQTSNHPTMMVSNSDTDLTIKLKDNSEKQILTLTEDGHLEMTEITCWGDIQPSESQPNIFQ